MPNSSWQNQDLTVTTGDWATAGSGSSVSSSLDSYGEHVMFTGPDQGIYQMYYNSSEHAWQAQNLSSLTGYTAAFIPTGLSALSNSEATFYSTTAQHLDELYYYQPNWYNYDVTSNTPGGSLVALGSAISSSIDGSTTSIYYLGANQHIYVVSNSGSGWQITDLNATTGAVMAASNTELVSY